MTHADWWYQQSKYVNYKHDRVFEEVSQNGWGASAAQYTPLVEACERLRAAMYECERDHDKGEWDCDGWKASEAVARAFEDLKDADDA